MTTERIFHAIGLHMHQPPGNLHLLHEANPWEAEQILRCYERAVRYAEQYRDVARLHVSFSGVLLEQLLDPGIVDHYRGCVDIPAMLERYRTATNIEILGTGYYHPIIPLIPHADWSEQITLGRTIIEQVFGRAPRGFWPPELAFSMEMIPLLTRAGYEYALVDSVHVRPADGLNDTLRPYRACHEGLCLTIIPRDRDLSNAQGHGCNPHWLRDELSWRVAVSPRPDEDRLFVTWSDGENGAWFRQTHEPSGFFGHFWAPYLEQCRSGEIPVQPILLSDYLDCCRPIAPAHVQTGTWSAHASGYDNFLHWVGSDHQRQVLAEIHHLSERYWSLRRLCPVTDHETGQSLTYARRQILEAQTSCFLYWGEAWLPYLQARTRAAGQALAEAASRLDGCSSDKAS
ncbi:glycoside hydrolase family 57 [Caldichromatium japonicum]|uniref:Glycoside hydrolase family 57 n=1 Tax=Caldichromatium japonicum TaxID=2699430 RepID=A0A6G7VDK6_9GAMM|nr:glycoside hydrolase family 57 [Caldichromatium japonicum]QIK38153.1 glycoside hydrolase family 57 [Caldichromatium japonicum]